MKNIVPIVLIALVLAGVIGAAAYYKGLSTGKIETEMTNEVPTPTLTVEQVKSQIALTITSPLAGATVKTQSVTLKGKTAPNAEVFVNDTKTMADAEGNFSATVTLDEGENTIVVVANDADGNSTETQFIINYEIAE